MKYFYSSKVNDKMNHKKTLKIKKTKIFILFNNRFSIRIVNLFIQNQCNFKRVL